MGFSSALYLFFPLVTLILSENVFSQTKNANENILGAKPGIIINGNTDCKIGHLNLSCVPVECDSIVIFSGDSIRFCTDQDVDLISDPAYFIQWNFNGSSNFPSSIIDHAPNPNTVCYSSIWNTPGNYTVDIFYNGWLSAHPYSDCFSQGPSHWIIKVNVESLNGINEESKNLKHSVYPNPANNNLNVDFSFGGKGILELYSSLGEKAGSYLLKNGNNTFSIEDLNPGIYFYRLFENEKLITSGKIILIR